MDSLTRATKRSRKEEGALRLARESGHMHASGTLTPARVGTADKPVRYLIVTIFSFLLP